MDEGQADVKSTTSVPIPTAIPDSDTRVWVEVQDIEDDGEESLNVWGFAETRYQLTNVGDVEITGTRYSSSGQTLSELIPWISGQMKVDPAKIIKLGAKKVEYPPVNTPAPFVNIPFMERLGMLLRPDQISQQPLERLRHSHGHSQNDMYSVNYGTLQGLTDLVIYPENAAEVLAITNIAREAKVRLIPYGGGTNVSEALSCPAEKIAMVATVSMRRLNKIVWVDKVNGLAKIEAGAAGRRIARCLGGMGLTLGHEPDSFEFSTLGGWIATKASGMKKNKYGNIEDIVLEVEMVTHCGIIAPVSVLAPPRVSVLNDLKSLVFGSEGSLGIITSAIVKVFPLPTIQKYGSLLFPTFEAGFKFMKQLTSCGMVPASVRLVDNTQFQFAQALKPVPTGVDAIKSYVIRAYVLKYLGFDPHSMAVCTLVFEGQASEVKSQQAAVYRLGKAHGGVNAGADAGKRGYEMTFAIAYIRDFAMSLSIMAESFETSCAWSQAMDLCTRVKLRVREEHRTRHLPGEPFITSRISQVYHSGVTVYFYLAIYSEGVNDPPGTFAQLEEAARDEILLSGGSLSHHHGVGNLRKHFLPRVMSIPEIQWRQGILASTALERPCQLES